MGISWSSCSNRRRHNPYYHHHHQPPPPPPPYYYSTEPPFSLPAQPPPPPPPPPPLNYSPYPAPPPPIQYPYSNSCGYASNHMVGRFNYQPFYYPTNSTGWPAMSSQMGHVQSVQPPPFVEHSTAKRVKNAVNVHKDSLKLLVDDHNPDHHLLSFVFDALSDGSISIFYFGKEEANCKFVSEFPEAHLPVKIPFQKGPAQKFTQPSGTGIDLGFFELDDLSKPSPEEDVFPLVIVAETEEVVDPIDEHDDDSTSATSHMQITQAVLEKKNSDSFQVRVIKQILWVDGVRYELREIYGIDSSSSEGFNDSDPGKECVICMTEPKDTAVLPCRHMCMCGECAKELRVQSNKCPICRQPIEGLIGIKIDGGE